MIFYTPEIRSLPNQAQKKTLPKTQFINLNYYLLENTAKQLKLVGHSLTQQPVKGLIHVIRPKGFFFNSDNSKVHYEALYGRMREAEKIVHLSGTVFLHDPLSKLTCDEATYFTDKDFFEANRNVSSLSKNQKNGDIITVRSHYAKSWPTKKIIHYFGDVDGKVLRKKVYEPPIFFQSMKAFLNSPNKKVDLEEDVVIKRHLATATGHRGEIFLDNYNNKLKYYALYQNVKLEEKVYKEQSNSYVSRTAYGEQLDGFAKTGKMILTGNPKVIQQSDIIKGNKIILYHQNDILEVDDSDSSFKVK